MKVLEIMSALEKNKVRCSVVGGYAVALHGVVRGTINLDLILEHSNAQFQLCESTLKSLGFVSRLPVSAKDVFHFRKEYISQRNLIAWSFYKPHNPLEIVDIIITEDLSKMKSIRIKSGDFSFPVLSLKDLIRMKKKAGRPQDLEDIIYLEKIEREKEK